MDRPPLPPLPTDRPSPVPTHYVLAAFAILALGLLGYRGYANHLGVRPSEHHPAASRHLVDLNAADKSELLQVPGVGPALADAIVTHRQDRGPFAAVEDLSLVRGVGDKTLDKLRPWLTVSATSPLTPVPLISEPPIERLERKPVAIPPLALGTLSKIRPGDPPIDVNAADEATLQRLPGIGPTLAARIVLTRGTERFQSPDDLRRVKGIGVKTMESVRPYVVCR